MKTLVGMVENALQRNGVDAEATRRYVYLELPEHGLEVHVKLDDEDVVVDVWSQDDGNSGEGVIASTYKLYQEMGVDVAMEKIEE